VKEIKFKKLHEDAQIPTRGTERAAGLDIYALEDCVIPPCELINVPMERSAEVAEAVPVMFVTRVKVGQISARTGIAVEIPDELFGKVESRSGSSFKHGIETGAGVIDSDYRGEVNVKLYNFTDTPYTILKGQRIAQLIILPYVHCTPIEAENLDMDTKRGENGLGHTGK
jgi:dUTP pyrophosphatase